MMSGVAYDSDLDGFTITHDFDASHVRKDGGFFNLGKVITSINQTNPEITGVALSEPIQTDRLVTYRLKTTFGTSENWTISWGDNSPVDVLAGTPSLLPTPSRVTSSRTPTTPRSTR